ncbi:MAG: DoxX family protein [Rikenellaceae bacterium]|nr:DoxX family protein [Rikenellaceae bacterium]
MKKILLSACRIVLGATFCFSGFMKIVDPWGGAFKLGEYFSAFGIERLSATTLPLAVVLAAVELTLGASLLLGLRKWLIAGATLLFMAFFTLLTLYSAVFEPVGDCGCFGDAVKLTSWQTFAKNLILLPMAWATFRSAPRERKRDAHYVAALLMLGCSIGIFAIRHLPLIDFLPYKVGTDLIEARNNPPQSGETETTLIYRDRSSGRTQEFALSDTTWYDTVRWEYVDTRIVFKERQKSIDASEFNIFTPFDGDLTDSLLFDGRPTTLLCVTELDRIAPRCRRRLARAAAEASENGDNVLCITTTPITASTRLTLDQQSYPCANIDGTLLKTLLRARVGIVRIAHGTIVAKRSCTDI